MGRPPRAREAVLDAARSIVIDRGAGALTFEELASVSGVTRGGITYHFPTKEALLSALVEEDVAQWRSAQAELAPQHEDPETGALLAAIRLAAGRDEEQRRFVSGMLSAVTLDPSLLRPCRSYFEEVFAREQWSDADLRRFLIRLAADGLFWLEVFRLYEVPPPVRERLVALMETLAVHWGPAGDVTAPAPPQGETECRAGSGARGPADSPRDRKTDPPGRDTDPAGRDTKENT